MKDDLTVLITRAESKGAALRVRGAQLEVWGLERLSADLVNELKDRKSDLVKRLVDRDAKGQGTARLLAWASELAEQDLAVETPVRFTDVPRHSVSTMHPSWYATQYLRTIVLARQEKEIRRWCHWTPEWWREREEEGIAALERLRRALTKSGNPLGPGTHDSPDR